MNSAEFAKLINGREYPFQLTKEEQQIAKQNNLLVVCGSSDDIVEFYGVFNDEYYVGHNSVCHVNDDGVIQDWESIDHNNEEIARKYFQRIDGPKIKIVYLWGENNASWSYEIEVEHYTFNIIEDDEIYCIGAVIDMSVL